MTIEFTVPASTLDDAVHHTAAASGNIEAANRAIQSLMDVLNGVATYDKILLRAAAGAGKSYALVRMVKEALANPNTVRVAITAFANKQVFPLAERLGAELGADKVCLFVSEKWRPKVPDEVLSCCTVVTKSRDIPAEAQVVLGVSHKFRTFGELNRMRDRLGPGANGDTPFDVLFVDEAWQLPLHLFIGIAPYAPLAVGVGDVGQLPPIDPAQNPWRGDPGYNPYRAWPTAFEGLENTLSIDLPAVWRPTGEQLALWRAFYSDWESLNCVAAPRDRSLDLPDLPALPDAVWTAVGSGYPTLLEVSGLEDPESADVDQPLLDVVRSLLEPLLAGGFGVVGRSYDEFGAPGPEERIDSTNPSGDPLVVVLATRNAAVDDAADVVERLVTELDLPEGVVQASTVDSWQGQTNRLTIAIHPLSGAAALDEFNSAFGRLAVTCTRATHGLLMVSRAGLDELLDDAAARPGTPFGEPGTRSLPRQTHQRILRAFSRGQVDVADALDTNTAGAMEPSG